MRPRNEVECLEYSASYSINISFYEDQASVLQNRMNRDDFLTKIFDWGGGGGYSCELCFK